MSIAPSSAFLPRHFEPTRPFGHGISKPHGDSKSSTRDARVRNVAFCFSPSSPYSFEQYLKAQKKRNIKQILYYAQRYHNVLETGDASALVSLQSGAVRRHVMEALVAYAKYTGYYERWQQIRKSYSLHWTNGDESLQAFNRFFNSELDFDSILQRIKEMMKVLPAQMARIVKFACLVGLRASEVIESAKLINEKEAFSKYYNVEQITLSHFKFPEIFLRQTKKAFISYITLDNLQPIANLGTKTPTLNAISRACNRRFQSCDMHMCRKVFASWLRHKGIQPEVVDMLQGRVSQSVLTRHYLVPQQGLKDQVLDALKELQNQL